MKNFHAWSWSKQSRAFYINIEKNINKGYWTIERASLFIHTSHRAAIIRGRVAKRLGRRLRAGKVIEQSQAVEAWKKELEKHSDYYLNEKRGFRY